MKKLILILLLISQYAFSQGIDNGKQISPLKVGIKTPLSTGVTYDTSALRYFASMTVQPSEAVKIAINNFILALKSTYCTKQLDSTSFSDTTLWQRKDVIVILGMHDTTASLLDLKGYKNGISIGTPVFEAWKGFTSATGKYINTQYNPTIHKINFALNSGTISTWQMSLQNADVADIGAGQTRIQARQNFYLIGAINGTVGNEVTYSSGVGVGYMTVSKTDSVRIYFNGACMKTAPRNTQTLTNATLFALGLNNGGSALTTTKQYWCYDIGGGMSTIDQKNYYNALAVLKLALQQSVAVVTDGNSLTYATPGYPSQLQTLLGSQYVVNNQGYPGYNMNDLLNLYPTKIAPLYSTVSFLKNILIVWEGTNSLVSAGLFANSSDTAYSTYDKYRRYCLLAKATGFKVIVLTTLPMSGGKDAERDSLNTLLKANYSSFADTIINLNSDSRIGDTGDNNDLTYYADGTHLTQAGYAIVAGMVNTAITNFMKKYL